jgi:hypothetical protein
MMPETTEPLKERLFRASIAGCTCGAKSPDILWHDPLCHYRLFTESIGEISRLEGVYLSAVKGRRDMRAALRVARAERDIGDQHGQS